MWRASKTLLNRALSFGLSHLAHSIALPVKPQIKPSFVLYGIELPELEHVEVDDLGLVALVLEQEDRGSVVG